MLTPEQLNELRKTAENSTFHGVRIGSLDRDMLLAIIGYVLDQYKGHTEKIEALTRAVDVANLLTLEVKENEQN